MKVTFENPDKVNGLLTITIAEDDYKQDVDKELKDYRKKANMPGFRPGQVPMGLIKRQVGAQVKMDAINKVVGEAINKYITDNKIAMLGQPLASEKQEPQDLEKPAPYTFMFDIAVAPEFDITLDANDTIDYYDIQVDDALIDRQVDAFASRMGQYAEAEAYAEGDTLKGDLRELDAEGNTLEGGVTVEGAMLMPSYIRVDDQKKRFDGAKVGDIITFNPRKAYPDNDAEVASLLKVEKDKLGFHTGDFSFQVTQINHFEKHAVDQELFDGIYGKGQVKDEADFRQKISQGLKQQLTTDQDYKFLLDVRKYAEAKVGALTYPDSLLKRILKLNNEKLTDEQIEKDYEQSRNALGWNLIREKLAEQNGVQVKDEDVHNVAREVARAQFAQYGMANLGDEYLDNYVGELLKKRENVQSFADRAVDEKLAAALKGKVTLNKKEISIDDFNKMMTEEQQA